MTFRNPLQPRRLLGRIRGDRESTSALLRCPARPSLRSCGLSSLENSKALKLGRLAAWCNFDQLPVPSAAPALLPPGGRYWGWGAAAAAAGAAEGAAEPLVAQAAASITSPSLTGSPLPLCMAQRCDCRARGAGGRGGNPPFCSDFCSLPPLTVAATAAPALQPSAAPPLSRREVTVGGGDVDGAFMHTAGARALARERCAPELENPSSTSAIIFASFTAALPPLPFGASPPSPPSARPDSPPCRRLGAREGLLGPPARPPARAGACGWAALPHPEPRHPCREKFNPPHDYDYGTASTTPTAQQPSQNTADWCPAPRSTTSLRAGTTSSPLWPTTRVPWVGPIMMAIYSASCCLLLLPEASRHRL